MFPSLVLLSTPDAAPKLPTVLWVAPKSKFSSVTEKPIILLVGNEAARERALKLLESQANFRKDYDLLAPALPLNHYMEEKMEDVCMVLFFEDTAQVDTTMLNLTLKQKDEPLSGTLYTFAVPQAGSLMSLTKPIPLKDAHTLPIATYATTLHAVLRRIVGFNFKPESASPKKTDLTQ